MHTAIVRWDQGSWHVVSGLMRLQVSMDLQKRATVVDTTGREMQVIEQDGVWVIEEDRQRLIH